MASRAPAGLRPDMVALVEGVEVQRDRPRARRHRRRVVDPFAPPTDDRHVVGTCPHDFAGMPVVADLVAHLVGLDGTAEAYRVDDVGPGELPRVAMREPVVRRLPLPAIGDELLEETVVVADAVSDGRYPDRRHAFHEAGGEAAEAAIAQGRIMLGGAKPIEVDVEAGQGLARLGFEAEIAERLRQAPADQELHREIVDLLGGLAAGRSLCRGVDDMVANGERSGAIPVELARVLRPPADVIGELRKNGRTQRCAPFLGLRPDAAWRLEPLTRRLRYASGTFRRALRIALDREVVRHETATSSQPDTRGNSCRTERFLTMRLVSAPLTARALVRTLLTGNREAGRADGFCGVATGFGDREAPRSRGHLALK